MPSIRHLIAAASLGLGAALSSCTPVDVNDPVRAQFLAACDARIKHMKPDKRTAYCQCGYDVSLAGLSEDEKQLARFYLLGAVGDEATAKQLAIKPDFKAMTKASNAIGAARYRCG